MATLPYYYEQLNDMRVIRVPSAGVCYTSETFLYFWQITISKAIFPI